MKMAKASEKDIEAAGQLMQILDAIDSRFGGPWPTDGPESLEAAIGDGAFDEDKPEHLQGLYNSLAALLRRAPNFHGRVIGGMCYVILYGKNEIVDPNADVLELHPRLRKALANAEASQQKAAAQESDAWRAMAYAPIDGTEVELLLHHHNRRHANNEEKKMWEAVVRAKWIDFNGGGWTWTGMAGVPMGWRPVNHSQSDGIEQRASEDCQ